MAYLSLKGVFDWRPNLSLRRGSSLLIIVGAFERLFCPEGWMLKLRFDWYITVVRVWKQKADTSDGNGGYLETQVTLWVLSREGTERGPLHTRRFWDLWCESKVHRKRTKARLNWLPLFPCGSPAKESRVEKEALEYGLGKSVDL